MRRPWVLVVILAVQAICALFFLSDMLSSLIGFRTSPISWQYRELMELGAAVGLILGLGTGGLALVRAHQRSAKAEAQLRVASGAFMELMQERFTEWGLTAAERDVALFAMKGLSIQEISQVRQTSEGTVKAQTAAIYRKAGVSGRAQLVSLFIEDLMEEGISEKAKALRS